MATITEQHTYTTSVGEIKGQREKQPFGSKLRLHVSKQVVLLLFTAVLLFGSIIVSNSQPNAFAASPGAGNGCVWYRIQRGDTLTKIAVRYHTTIWTLARVNYIRNVNLIIVGHELCIPYRLRGGTGSGRTASGILPDGIVRWYAYNALQWSTRSQVNSLLHRAASIYHLPSNLLLAIAWQESGWTQHVIAWDGGIGVMQLMPYTAQGLNAQTRIRRDPYLLWDNINLGATYLRSLWNGFHGNLTKVISGYNEGGWAVIHRGIFNWRYVNNVLALMQRFRYS
ncbi:MAG TPA: transglycosylase SLT domain-containing protein [Ktedonobacteraceae bacterium]|nr:transglycosylase SLT domain-containing protein [Ktedonobacteraceae bacterium]